MEVFRPFPVAVETEPTTVEERSVDFTVTKFSLKAGK
jgi:hypothetical protein